MNTDCNTLVTKMLVISAALYLLYIGYTCPCRPHIYSCHLTGMYTALLLIVAVLIAQNGLKFVSY